MSRVYLFDLDGTLLDSIELILASFRHTYEVHFGETRPESYWVNAIGKTLRQQFGELVAEMGRSPEAVDAMVETYREHNLRHHDAMVRAYPGAVETVRALEGRGVTLAIVTSKMRVGAERGLAVMGIADAFPVCVCADDVERGKPDPMPVHLALEKLGARAEDAVFIGDSPHDVEAGRRAGVRTAAASWGPYPEAALREAGPDVWLGRLEEVLGL